MPNKLASQGDACEEKDEEENVENSPWSMMPDSLLLQVFHNLEAIDVQRSSQVCKHWQRISCDDFLWKELFYRNYKIERTIPIAPGKASWYSEYKRLYCHTPMVESEVLSDHRDQVLHVSFSHDGTMFATSSKDGFIKVWNAGYPARLKYYEDMRDYTWKYTQFSQFNENDTLLLVSGVHFGSHSTSGEIAVFNLVGGFELQCRVLNKPYDIFGTWYNESYLLSGNLYWTGNLTSCSVLWLNKAEQALESEKESVVSKMYKFHNVNASSIRTIMIAKCLDADNDSSMDNPVPRSDSFGESRKRKGSQSSQAKDVSLTECSQSKAKRKPKSCHSKHKLKVENPDDLCGTIEYNSDYRIAQSSRNNSGQFEECIISLEAHLDPEPTADSDNNISESGAASQLGASTSQACGFTAPRASSSSATRSQSPDSTMSESASFQSLSSLMSSSSLASHAIKDKYLIYTTGSITYTPHQIGVKRITCSEASDLIYTLQHDEHSRDINSPGGENNDQDGAERDEEFDTADHLIELHGHIIGMCLSPDHRYLYVNSRPWPTGYEIIEPLEPPPIAQEIDIHVIDLKTMQEVGKMHRSHKAYTPNDECFFIFLDVCDEYVSSGAEDQHGYLWDRHYGVCLTRYPHTDVVNCVAFNPRDSETLITVSDDHKIKVWRSRSKVAQLSAEEAEKKRVLTVGEAVAQETNRNVTSALLPLSHT